MKAFIFYDGRNMTEKFDRVYRANDIESLKLLSAVLGDIHRTIGRLCEDYGARVVECGGDEGTVECQSKMLFELAEKIGRVWSSYGLEASIGMGATVAEAYEMCKGDVEPA